MSGGSFRTRFALVTVAAVLLMPVGCGSGTVDQGAARKDAAGQDDARKKPPPAPEPAEAPPLKRALPAG